MWETFWLGAEKQRVEKQPARKQTDKQKKKKQQQTNKQKTHTYTYVNTHLLIHVYIRVTCIYTCNTCKRQNIYLQAVN